MTKVRKRERERRGPGGVRRGGSRAAHAEHCCTGTAGLHGAQEGATELARGLLQADTPDVRGKLLQDPGVSVHQSSQQSVLSTDPLSLRHTARCGAPQSCRSIFAAGPTAGPHPPGSPILISHTRPLYLCLFAAPGLMTPYPLERPAGMARTHSSTLLSPLLPNYDSHSELRTHLT